MTKSRLPGPVILLILSLITIVIWTSFELLRTFTKPVDIAIDPAVLNPLDPKLNEITLNSLPDKIYLSDDQILDLPIAQAALPSPTASPTPVPEPELTEEEIVLEEEP